MVAVVVVVVVVVACFLVCEDLGRMFNHSFLACAFFFFFFEVEISSRTLIRLFNASFSPQWLSELRRLWPNVS